MKRHGNLFDKITNIENLRLAYHKARKGKTWQRAIKEFEKNAEGNLLKIRNSLVNKTFTTSPYKTKIIHEPKKRQIYILPFTPDRIVQHALMNILEPIYEGLFTFHSYSCRLNKGTHAASRKTMEFVRKNKYCLQCDIAKFYPSVKHDILSNIVRKKIKCKDTLWIINDIIHSFEGKQNLPIGNFTSQWLGNLYLNELDQYLKHKYKIKYYLRYCDDFIAFHDDKKYLQYIAKIIENFIANKLGLSLSKCAVFPVSQGIDFVGYRHFKKYILIRKSTTKRVKKRLSRLPKQLEKGYITHDQFRSSLASTTGWLKWANSHNLYSSLQIDKLIELYNAT